jgi:hypothetical protein
MVQTMTMFEVQAEKLWQARRRKMHGVEIVSPGSRQKSGMLETIFGLDPEEISEKEFWEDVCSL